jgi:hypothetical protein
MLSRLVIIPVEGGSREIELEGEGLGLVLEFGGRLLVLTHNGIS